MTFIAKDITKFKPTHTYYLEVDLRGNDWMETKSGMDVFIPDEAGDVYQSKPFLGKLVAAPAKSTIPLGETVYVMYQAYDTLTKFGDKDYYIVTDDLIIGYGEPDNITPYKCVLVDVAPQEKKKRIITEVTDDIMMDAVGGVKDKKIPPHKATVIASDNSKHNLGAKFNAGDEIEYVGGVDWEFFVNRKVRYFIRWTDRIIKRNGRMINNYIEVEPKARHISRGGIVLSNPDPSFKVIKGKFRGKRVYIVGKRLELGAYVKTDFVLGHLTE